MELQVLGLYLGHNELGRISKPFCSSFVGVAKRAGRVGFGSGQLGLRIKRVTGQNGSFLKRVNRVAGQTGRGLSRVVSRVELTRIFQTIFFFFFWK